MTYRSKLFITLFCIVAASLFCAAHAQTGITVKKPLIGSLNQLKPDSSVTVIDSMYYDPAFNSKLNKPYPVRNIVTFKLDEASGVYLGSAFSATALLRIVYTNESGVTDSIEKNFAINYESSKTYTARQSYVLNNAHTVTVRVLSVTITSGASRVLGALMVENQMDIFPDYKFACATDAVQSVSFTTPTAPKPDELRVSWPVVSGATEYDLEWAYADSFAIAEGRYLTGGQPDPSLVFAHNATRITTTASTYTIPLLFDHAGSLFFRVRAVSGKDRQRRIETAWSSSFTGGLGRYDFAGHEVGLNWQSTVSYAEEGKRKAVVQYYDGSLRSRQTVTKDNTLGTTVVAETLYDYQGRPSIQVMPAPTLNTIISYSKQFNVGLNGSEYEKQSYDSIMSGTTDNAPAMGTQSGASQYYSSNNPLKTGYHAFIPDANGYVFTQTKYTQDNTGRIAAQGGVGDVFQLGKGHETKYYYGSPDQSELDALFGTEVGDASHYFKNMVRDANGQHSVSYVDMHGRTIATALAGVAADTIKLDTLASYRRDTVTENLLTTRVVKDLVMESKKSLLVSKEGLHSFHYGLDPQSLQKDGCNAQTFCYSCLYDLEIKITDDDNNKKLGGVPYIKTVRNFSLDTIPADCNGQAALNVSFDLMLDVGSYEITKTLSINREGAAYLRDSLFLARNTCISYEQQVAIQRLLQKESSCEPDCASCTAALGSWDSFRDNYMTQAGVAVSDSAANRGAALAAYTAAQEACKSLCDKRTAGDDARSAMLQDMSAPSGQYADITRASDKYSIFYDDPATDTDIPYYKTASLVYLNEEGQPDLVYSDSTQTYVTPQQLGAAEFAAKFKTSWAATLLPHHPEYCKLQVYESNAASLAWDRAFESTDTYADAVSKGYLNPTGAATAPFNQYTANSSYTDPLSLVSSTFKARLQDSLQSYRSANVGSVSLWAVASFMTKCVNSDAACAEPYRQTPPNCFNSSWCDGDKDMAWRAFRTLYLNIKQNIYGELQNSCTPTGQQLLTAGHTLNFQNASTALAQNGLGSMSGLTDEATAKAAAAAQLAAAIDSNCHAYVKMWVKQLAPCSYDTAAVRTILIPKLLQVCKEGGDVSHPFGASTVKPGSTYSYHSFTEVLNEFKQQHPGAVTDVAACNAELITAPQPYDQQRAYSNKPIWNKPDSCECTTINNLYTLYSTNPDGAVTFAAYLKKQLNTTISEADLQELRTRCNYSISCQFLQTPISLPPALQCNTGTVCISCAQMDSLKTLFSAAYPGIVPTFSETDTAQQLRNQLYANFMNNRLGFSKQAWEYLMFDSTCRAAQEHSFQRIASAEKTGVGGATGEDDANEATTTIASNKKFFQQPFNCAAVQSLRTSFNALYPLSMGDTLTLTKVVPASGNNLVFQTYYAMTYPDTSYAVFNTRGVTAGTWTSSAQWFNVRANLVFDLTKLPGNATINAAWMNLYAKDSTGVELSPCCGAHYRRDTDYVYGILERQLAPLTVSTTWSTLPATTTTNSVILPHLKISNGNGGTHDFFSDQDYTGIPCTELVRDMYAQPSYQNYGVMFRQSDETVPGYKMYSFWGQSPLTPVGKQPTLTVNCKASRRDMFTAYVDSALNMSYTTSFLESMLQNYCGEVTANTNMLCGKAEPVYPESPLEHVSACSDSTNFIISTATDIFNARRDSLKGSFDSAYLAKCLAAQNYESFTVTHAKSEYHYTLYYYDQAGNLLKTVPPAGVVYNNTATWLSQVKAARAAGTAMHANHTMVTSYRYNTLNQVVTQSSPDGGTSNFWYDRLGRLAISQNAKQLDYNQYSYTNYDYLGRITEVGQLTSTTAMDNTTSRSAANLNTWLSNVATSREQITKTVYDEQYGPLSPVMDAKNLRTRVSYTALYNNNTDYTASNHASATFYTYDIHGNVDTLLQDYKQGVMADNGNRFKKIVYSYDLISGKVNHVAYQPNQPDAFYHRYSYDAENRITGVETSRDSIYWEADAQYTYYKHGPQARTVLGQQQVQGVDYAYTLQGWMKTINPEQEGSGSPSAVAADAYNIVLNYYNQDYKNVSATLPATDLRSVLGQEYRGLYNGNISSMGVNINTLNSGQLGTAAGGLLYNYQYDALNRLVQMDAWKNRTASSWTDLQKLADFHEGIVYDGNGNIQRYQRNGNASFAGTPLAMDNLTYHYIAGTNQLDHIDDAVPDANYKNDLDGQAAGNYHYDEIGNLTVDTKEGISAIEWTVYGKIAQITKANGTVITYTYDPGGNRISKKVNTETSYYVRDASGNTLSIYQVKPDSALKQREINMYGSARLGMIQVDKDVTQPQLNNGYVAFTRGQKQYELSNHLGNVLATVSDKKQQVSTDLTTVDSYNPDVLNAQDYYPFGMLMPGRNGYKGSSGSWINPGANALQAQLTVNNRDNNLPTEYLASQDITFTDGFASGVNDAFEAYIATGGQQPGGGSGTGDENNSGYRYGFNGKENDDDVKGEGNQQDYGMRIYDPRLGRFLSVDPLSYKYSGLTPYQFASNSPLANIDIDGLESAPAGNGSTSPAPSIPKIVIDAYYLDAEGKIETGTLPEMTVSTKRHKTPTSTNPGAPKLNGTRRYKMTIENTDISSYTYNGSSYLYFQGKMALDVDGSLRAYHPNNIGIDYNSNGGIPGSEYGIEHWPGAKGKRGKRIVQGANDPYPGYYLSQTTLQNPNVEVGSVLHNLNAEAVSYIALPPAFYAMGVKIGDVAYVYNPKTGLGAFAIFGDQGPTNKLGEGSWDLLKRIGVAPHLSKKGNHRAVGGVDDKTLQYFIFPKSGGGLPFPLDNSPIDQRGKTFFEKLLSFKYSYEKDIDVIVIMVVRG